MRGFTRPNTADVEAGDGRLARKRPLQLHSAQTGGSNVERYFVRHGSKPHRVSHEDASTVEMRIFAL